MPRTESGHLHFEASARLQRLLGRDLMPDDFSALEELIKNSYDSNATHVSITIVRPTGRTTGFIEIRDNGTGLTLSQFQRRWMWAGYSDKTARPLPKTRRIQVGEKGIGRFAADRLGERLTVLTKTKSSRQVLRVVFDWRKFADQSRRLTEIPIPYDFVDEPLLSSAESGTILRIERLRTTWPDSALREQRVRLARLLNPYASHQAFTIDLKAPSQKLSGQISPPPIRNADFEWEVVRNSEGEVTFTGRRVGIEDQSTVREPRPPDTLRQFTHDLDERSEFGPVRARLYYFEKRPKKADVYPNVPGVAVYRDGLRVEPAGSSQSDWLGLLAKRAKRAGHMPLVPSRLFGFVEIDRTSNPHLRDATNRRAFIEGPPFEAFSAFLKDRLTDLESQVEEQVAQPRWEKSKSEKSRKLIQAGQHTLSVLSLGLAHELRQPLQTIQAASENIDDYLLANNVTIPQVHSASDAIRRNVARIEKHIEFMKNIGSGREELDDVRVEDVADEVLDAFRERATAHGVELSRKGDTSSPIVFNRWTFLMTLTNLVLNAYEAMESRSDVSKHRIEIRVEPQRAGVYVFVEDDGPGIPETVRQRLFRRATTSKQGGMGAALIIWRNALRMFGGDLICASFAHPTAFLINLPSEGTRGPHTAS